jgi:hypothetical protein
MIILNSTVILKVTSQLKEYEKNTRRTPNISRLNINCDLESNLEVVGCLCYKNVMSCDSNLIISIINKGFPFLYLSVDEFNRDYKRRWF